MCGSWTPTHCPARAARPFDGMHMTVQSHKVLAKALQKELTGDTL